MRTPLFLITYTVCFRVSIYIIYVYTLLLYSFYIRIEIYVSTTFGVIVLQKSKFEIFISNIIFHIPSKFLQCQNERAAASVTTYYIGIAGIKIFKSQVAFGSRIGFLYRYITIPQRCVYYNIDYNMT